MLMAVSVRESECVVCVHPLDGWMCVSFYSVRLAYYLSYVEVWEQGMVHVMLVP